MIDLELRNIIVRHYCRGSSTIWSNKVASIKNKLLGSEINHFEQTPISVEDGTRRTTDTPFRETISAIEFLKNEATCVEEEHNAELLFRLPIRKWRRQNNMTSGREKKGG